MAKKKPGFNTSGNPTTIEVNGSKINFEKTNRQLSKELDLAPMEVQELRSKHARHTAGYAYTLEEIDLEKTVKEIQKDIGISLITIRRIRKQYAPDKVRKYRRSSKAFSKHPPYGLLAVDLERNSDNDAKIVKLMMDKLGLRKDKGLSFASMLLHEISKDLKRKNGR